MVAVSFAQMQNFRQAQRLWPFSETNAKVLLEAGLDPSRIEVVDPVVPWPKQRTQAAKSGRPIEVLFVGRITKSKGVLDLLDAVDRIRSTCAAPFRLSVVGKAEEDSYVAAVQSRCADLAPIVEFAGQIGNDDLQRRYHAAHVLAIPSYHEGFCRPVVEGLRAGCVPVGYASYNLPTVANGLGSLVKPGDVIALSAALQAMIEGLAAAHAGSASLPLDHGPTTVAAFDSLAAKHAAKFNFDRFRRSVVRGTRALAR
jgi:glycosyltransferase involved in cell wall biosynthesis